MTGFPLCKYLYATYAQMIEMGGGVIFAECHLQNRKAWKFDRANVK